MFEKLKRQIRQMHMRMRDYGCATFTPAELKEKLYRVQKATESSERLWHANHGGAGPMPG